jgi:hypothetical protein
MRSAPTFFFMHERTEKPHRRLFAMHEIVDALHDHFQRALVEFAAQVVVFARRRRDRVAVSIAHMVTPGEVADFVHDASVAVHGFEFFKQLQPWSCVHFTASEFVCPQLTPICENDQFVCHLKIDAAFRSQSQHKLHTFFARNATSDR